MSAEQLESLESRELSPAEAELYNDILQTLISRVAARTNGDAERQVVINTWVEVNAGRYDEAYSQLLDEKPEFVTDQSYASREAAIKYIEGKLRK